MKEDILDILKQLYHYMYSDESLKMTFKEALEVTIESLESEFQQKSKNQEEVDSEWYTSFK